MEGIDDGHNKSKGADKKNVLLHSCKKDVDRKDSSSLSNKRVNKPDFTEFFDHFEIDEMLTYKCLVARCKKLNG